MGFLEDMLLAPVRLVSGVARQAKIVIFAASAARAYKALEQVEEGDGKRAETERTHGENAQKLLELCQSLGGFFTKLGQILSTQTKVLPKEYVDALSKLCDDTPSQPWSHMMSTFVGELGGESSTFFSRVEDDAIASASIAQVHRATLRTTGASVVIKVQHPGLEFSMRGDMLALNVTKSILKLAFPTASQLDYLHSLMEDMVVQELDFSHEAANMEAMRAALLRSGDARLISHIHIPAVLSDCSGVRVLTMEYIGDAVKLNDKAGIKEKLGLQSADVISLMCDFFAACIFIHGAVHGDLHPGNVLVRRRRKPRELAVAAPTSPAGTTTRGTAAAPVKAAIRTEAEHMALVSELQAEHFAEDLMPPRHAVGWTRGDLARFFESGGDWSPAAEHQEEDGQETREQEQGAPAPAAHDFIPRPAPLAATSVSETLSEPQLCIIDHGLHVTLSEEFRLAYAHLWVAIRERSEAKLKEAATQLGTPDFYEAFPPLLAFVPYDAWVEKRAPEPFELRMMAAGRGRGFRKPDEMAAFFGALGAEFPVIMRTNQQMAAILWQLGGWAKTLSDSMGAYAAKAIMANASAEAASQGKVSPAAPELV